MHTHNFIEDFLVLRMVIPVHPRWVWNIQDSPASAPPVLGLQVHIPGCLTAFYISLSSFPAGPYRNSVPQDHCTYERMEAL